MNSLYEQTDITHHPIFIVSKSHDTLKLDVGAFLEDEYKYGNNPINNLDLIDNEISINGNKKKACKYLL